jgi:hypothetical protein
MEQGGFGGRYETVMSSGGAAELRDFGRSMFVRVIVRHRRTQPPSPLIFCRLKQQCCINSVFANADFVLTMMRYRLSMGRGFSCAAPCSC